MPVVGLVGGMAAGKSWLSSALSGTGALVIDADRVGHQLLERPDIRGQVCVAFSGVEDRTDPSPAGQRRIDRRALGSLVFSDPRAKRQLESILHPAMRERFEAIILEAEHSDKPPPMLVLDAAILLEAGWDDLCDLILFVDAPEELRHARLRQERGWTLDEIARREQAQWPLDQKKARAHRVVGPFRHEEDVSTAVSAVIELLRSDHPLAAPTPPLEPMAAR